MSAAEKLKALEPTHLTVESIGDVTLYALPLPQIVAVVEAAERLDADIETNYAAGSPLYLIAALTALEEALS